MNSYKDLKDQMNRIKEELEIARIREIEEVLPLIRGYVEDLGITADQIFGYKNSIEKPVRTKNYKYRKDDKYWTGKGRKPNWLRKELDAGEKLENFLIDK